jgi:hypothetical protein
MFSRFHGRLGQIWASVTAIQAERLEAVEGL